MTNKMTVYLDPRGPAQEEAEQSAEEIKQQLEEQAKRESLEKANQILSAAFAYLAILPFLFMFAYNLSLAKMFSLDKIGYVESLGIVVVARVLRGKNSNG